MQSHVDPCPLCEGPCPGPHHMPEIHDAYPFMTPEQIAMTKPEEPEVEPEPTPKTGKRARRLQEDRMRRPEDDR
jgi:hypothetical protein